MDAMPRTLAEARREFLHHLSPRILLACLALALILRTVVGEFSWWNVLPFVAVVAAQPFLEWTIRVFILHARPKQIAGRTFDSVVARDHRLHHQDPRDLPLIFIPFRWVGYLIGSVLLGGLLIPEWPMRTSFYVAAFAMAVIYEWSHFLIHTDYKPKTRMYRHLYDNHRWHHYRNEHYWFGITSTVGDQVLRTAPGRDDVPVSRTAKNLLGA
jgi:hypothetical protein